MKRTYSIIKNKKKIFEKRKQRYSTTNAIKVFYKQWLTTKFYLIGPYLMLHVTQKNLDVSASMLCFINIIIIIVFCSFVSGTSIDVSDSLLQNAVGKRSSPISKCIRFNLVQFTCILYILCILFYLFIIKENFHVNEFMLTIYEKSKI